MGRSSYDHITTRAPLCRLWVCWQSAWQATHLLLHRHAIASGGASAFTFTVARTADALAAIACALTPRLITLIKPVGCRRATRLITVIKPVGTRHATRLISVI